MAESSAIPLTPRVGVRLIPRSDARLAKLAAAGDDRAFAAIYERYHQELYRYCRAILGDSHEAEDALQGTMASALRALPGAARSVELRPWLYRVAHNESISILRRRQPVAEDSEPQLPREPAVDAVFESRERLRQLVADLSTLPERQRSALVMRELGGLSHDEVAVALGITTGAARQVVYEARQALQALEDGRAMECDRVRRALSDGDGRVLRGRSVRAHLRGCEGCRDFEAGIQRRSADLELLAPPLSAVAASGVLATVLGSGSAGAGALVAGGVGGGAMGAKVLGLIAASAAIGIGAGTVADVKVPGLGADSPAERAAEPAPAPSGSATEARDISSAPAPANRDDAQDGRPSGAESSAGGGKGAEANGQGSGNAHGQEAGVGPPEHAEGNATGQGQANGNAYGHDKEGNAYGHDKNADPPASPPGHSGEKTTEPPAHSNAGGASEDRVKPEKPLK